MTETRLPAIVFLTLLSIIAGLLIAVLFLFPIPASAADFGDIKDGFTIAAVVISQVFGAGAVYGAIRADFKHIARQIEDLKSESKDHRERIDLMMAGQGRRRRDDS